MPQKTICVDAGWNMLNGKYRFVADDMPAPDGCFFQTGRKIFPQAPAPILQNPVNIFADFISTFKNPRQGLAVALAATLVPLFKLFAEAGHAINFLIFIEGRSGSLKTAIAKAFFSYFSDAESLNSFESTAASFENTIKDSADCFAIFDDFHPPASKKAEREMNEKLEILIRYMGDGRGRQRSNAALSKIPSTPIRGMSVVTGEFFHGSLSSHLRYWKIAFAPGDIDAKKLAVFQSNASLWKSYLFQYIHYVEKNWASIVEKIRSQYQKVRESVSGNNVNLRIIDQIAVFIMETEIISDFLAAYGLNESVIGQLKEAMPEAILQASLTNESALSCADPSLAVIDALQNLLSLERLCITEDKNSFLANAANYDGYRDQSMLYVLPDSFCAKINEQLRLSRCNLSVDATAIRNYLHSFNLLKQFPNGKKKTFRKKIILHNGRSVGVFAIHEDKVFSINTNHD